MNWWTRVWAAVRGWCGRLYTPDETLLAAVALLKDRGLPTPSVPVIFVTQRPAWVSPNAEGWVLTGSQRIYIAIQSDTFRRAQAGDHVKLIKLAAVLVHEEVHLHDGDEARAYLRELDALYVLGAPEDMLDGVRRAMALKVV